MTIIAVLRITLSLPEPWAIGDAPGRGDRDMVVLRDRDGLPEIPAASLAGSLRAHLRRIDPSLVETLMGSEPGTARPYERGSDDDNGRKPSRLRVLGVRPSEVAGGDLPYRTTTAVNAATGSARDKTLRTAEFVPGASRYDVYLSCDGGLSDGERSSIFEWTPIVGRNATNGWGRAKVEDFRYGVVDLTRRDHLVAWLAGGGPGLIEKFAVNAMKPPSPATGRTVVHAVFETRSGLHVGTGVVDARTVSPTIARGGRPFVPASSWRGVIRARCAYILKSLDIPNANDRLKELFGGENRRGLLTFRDADVEDASSEPAEHVGIDRITGGARRGILFAEEVSRGRVRLVVTAREPDRLPHWSRPLLGHVVRDIADGYVGIGGRTTRGLGTLRLVETIEAPQATGIDRAWFLTEVASEE